MTCAHFKKVKQLLEKVETKILYLYSFPHFQIEKYIGNTNCPFEEEDIHSPLAQNFVKVPAIILIVEDAKTVPWKLKQQGNIG